MSSATDSPLTAWTISHLASSKTSCPVQSAELYERVWSQPMRILTLQCGVSDVYLARVCRILRIPLPGLGYLAKKSAGKTTKKRPPLPLLPDGGDKRYTN